MRDINREHATLRSYIIGFILSLIFTFIPYYLVVNHISTGSKLLAIILSFAVVQMMIQIIFFLHLGRGPKPNWNIFFFVSTFGIILVVVGGSVFIMNNLHYNMSPSDQVKKLVSDEGIYQVDGKLTGACHQLYINHVVTITNGQVSPAFTAAKKCDTLSIVNKDNDKRLIAFGSHPNHEVYAGESELELRKGQSQTITLSETGSFQFHDHLHYETAGFFTVSTQ